jgi:hypothetical protein
VPTANRAARDGIYVTRLPASSASAEFRADTRDARAGNVMRLAAALAIRDWRAVKPTSADAGPNTADDVTPSEDAHIGSVAGVTPSGPRWRPRLGARNNHRAARWQRDARSGNEA